MNEKEQESLTILITLPEGMDYDKYLKMGLTYELVHTWLKGQGRIEDMEDYRTQCDEKYEEEARQAGMFIKVMKTQCD